MSIEYLHVVCVAKMCKAFFRPIGSMYVCIYVCVFMYVCIFLFLNQDGYI